MKKIKPMRKLLLLSVTLVVLTMVVHSQNFYTRLGIGAGGGISANLDMLYNYSNDGTGGEITIAPLALGKGFTGVAAFGYAPSKYLSVELGISQFIGLPNIADSVLNLPGGSSAEVRVAGNMLSLLPSIVISPGFEEFNPYARVGFILGIRPTINATAEVTKAYINPPDELKAVKHFYGGVALGLNAALGVSWSVSKTISLYAEANFSSINYSPKYSEVITYEINGADQLPYMTEKEKNTEYYSKIYPEESIPDTSPDKELRKSLPFSNASFAFGITFKF